MTAEKKPKNAGKTQAKKPSGKKLPNGLDPSIGKDTQFRPGKSGNPAGMKPGTKHIKTWIHQLLHDEEFTATIRKGLTITEYKGAPIKAIIEAQIIRALDGDDKAFNLLAKYGYGSSLDLTTGGEALNNPYASLSAEELRKLARGK